MELTNRLLFCLLILCCYLPTTTLSQDQGRGERGDAATQPRDSVYHLTTGRSTLREIDGQRVLEMTGGVRIVHGDVTVTSDRGQHYDRRGVTILIGNVTIDQQKMHMEGDEGEYHRAEDFAILRHNVKIIDRGMTVTCDEATFYRRSQRASLVGNVVVVDSTSTLTADRVLYDQAAQVAEAFGRVRITNPEEGVAVWGRHGYYYRDRGEGLIDREPRLVVDPNSDEPATVDADTMRFFPDTRRAIAYGRVKIIKGKTVTQCDSTVVVDSLQTAYLYGNPLARQENISMQATRMEMHYSDEEVDQIRLMGNSRIVETPEDSLIIGRDNWIEGDSVVMHLRENRLDSIRVVGNASSEYYPGTPRKIEKNVAHGDQLFFVFERDSISLVEINGEARGLYRFLNLKADETVDSLRAVADTTLTFVPFDEKSEEISYSAEDIRYYAKRRDLILVKKSRIEYQNRVLLGDSITYNADLQLMDASGSPVLIEGQDKFYGNQMNYDLDSSVGIVTGGSTQFMQGYYNGDEIATLGNNVLKVWNSHYTTCDLKHPHYHFQAKEMKVYIDDKVVSGPIWLYVGDTPLFYLPFFAQNIRRGRRSGILRPDFEFGIGTTRGRFIRDLGYYWATNQYTDFLFSFDFNENSSLAGDIRNRYKKRYVFDGNVNLQYIRELPDNTNRWTVDAAHRHVLGDRFNFNTDLHFVSDENARRAVSNLDNVVDIIDRQVRSTASLSKTWSTAGFTVTAVREENLDVRDPNATKVYTNLPNVTMTIPSRTLYFGSEKRESRRSFLGRMGDNVRIAPRVDFNRTNRERLFDATEQITSNQSLGFSAPTKVSFLTISPSFSLSNRYTYTNAETFAHLPNDTSFVPASKEVTSENDFNWNTGARMNTNIYGTWYPELGAWNGIHHTLTPAVSYSYSPPRGKNPRRQSFSVGVTNTIDLKIGRGEEVRKLSGVLVWRLSSAYNPDAPSKKNWSNISSGLSARLFGSSVSYNQTLDPYTLEILSQQVSFTGIRLSGKHRFGMSIPSDEDEGPALNVIAAHDTTRGKQQQPADMQQGTGIPLNQTPQDYESQTQGTGMEETEGEGLPWNFALDFSYTSSRFGDPTSTMNLNAGISLTRAWRITYSATYDLQNRVLGRQAFSIYRDLHCWEMSLNRRELGEEWEFYFKLTLTGHPELFVDQGNRGLGGPSSFGNFQY